MYTWYNLIGKICSIHGRYQRAEFCLATDYIPAFGRYMCTEYWRAPNYRKNSIIGCRVISGTSSYADLRNLYTLHAVFSAAWKLKPHRKNGQITANNKHFTVENVCHPYPPTKFTCGGKSSTSKIETFSPKIATIIHLSYSLNILI